MTGRLAQVKPPIDTAVIPVAGIGSRMLEASADIPKFMFPLPVGDRTRLSIDFTLFDLLKAGVKNFIFIYSFDGDTFLKRRFAPLNQEFEKALVVNEKYKDLEILRERRAALSEDNGVQAFYIKQELGEGNQYGTAVPLYLAKDTLKELGAKNFLFYGGDDALWHSDGSSEAERMVAGWRNSGAENAIMGKRVPKDGATRYGILEHENGLLVAIHEKPTEVELEVMGVETPLANITRYIFNQSIFPEVEELLSEPSRHENGEYQITDAVNRIANLQQIHVHTAQGHYIDTGTATTLREAITYLASKHLT